MLMLWDLLSRKTRERFGLVEPTTPKAPPPSQKKAPTSVASTSTAVASRRVAPRKQPPVNIADVPARQTMQDRYDLVTRNMLLAHKVRVRRWRTSMSGIAWQITYRDGSVTRLIEAPRPRGPMSAAVFLHEIGHHAIGFNVYKPRCLEEYHAWAWALAAMEENNLNVTDAVRRRMAQSLRYAVDKARRRGLRKLPPELAPFARETL